MLPDTMSIMLILDILAVAIIVGAMTIAKKTPKIGRLSYLAGFLEAIIYASTNQPEQAAGMIISVAIIIFAVELSLIPQQKKESNKLSLILIKKQMIFTYLFL